MHASVHVNILLLGLWLLIAAGTGLRCRCCAVLSDPSAGGQPARPRRGEIDPMTYGRGQAP